MKKRCWLCLTLDFTGIAALIGACLSLTAALWFAGSLAEGVLLEAFRYSLAAAVAGLMASRMWELAQVFIAPQQAAADRAATEVAAELPANVQSLPERDELPRAA